MQSQRLKCPAMPDLTPEQLARQQIDAQLVACGWVVQDYKPFDPSAGRGIAAARSAAQIRPLRLPPARGPQGRRRRSRPRRKARPSPPSPTNPATTRTTCPTSSSRRRPARCRSSTNPPASRPSSATNAIPTRAPAASSPSTARRRSPPGPPNRTPCAPASPQMPTAHPLATRRHARLPDRGHHRTSKQSFAADHPRALIQMATGAGKTYTACSFTYRLIKHAGAKPRPVPRGPRQSRRAGHATSSSSSSRPTPAASSPSSTTSSTSPRNNLDAVCPRHHLHHPAALLDAARRGTRRGRRREIRLRNRRRRRPARGTWPTTRHPHRDLRLHRHRRMPPLHLRPLAAGARILRRLPHRPHRHALASRPSASSTRTS